MTAAHHAEMTVNAADLFPAEVWNAFRQSDTQAARAIVVLMQGIFIVGIVLYTIVLVTL
jgi:hypothetical protein